jgi:hypothetical protein
VAFWLVGVTAVTDGPRLVKSHGLPPQDFGALLDGAPLGHYLLEERGGWRIVWRLGEGEPPDGALEPGSGWPDGSARERV